MATDTTEAPPLDIGLRISLSIMMFLQFAVWGAWFAVLGNYLGKLGFGGDAIGSIYGTMALGTIFAPLFVGQIADRFFASERLMALLHLAGAGLLYYLSTVTDAGMFWWVALAYALVYSPTLALSNAIAFTHVPDATRDFPGIRVFGTIGWIFAGMTVGMILPRFADQLGPMFGIPAELAADPKLTKLPIILAAALSAVLGVFSLVLPHTPPKGQAGDAIPFLQALGLLKDSSFAVFFGVSFVITIVLAFYYGFTGLWLEKSRGVEDVASTMTIGQWSEMLLLPLLPWFLRTMGMKWVLALGMFAWGARYALFAFWDPAPVVIGNTAIDPMLITLALHGICYDFFFAAGFIHVDNESPPNIRGSAQALFTFLTYGLGMYIGNELSGRIAKMYTDEAGVIDWTRFWTVPSVGVAVALVIFVLAFRVKKKA